MLTLAQMLYSHSECRRIFGSPYQIAKAVSDGRLVKIDVGVYSDTGEESELAVVQWMYPKAVLTLDSAFFYYDLTDAVPDAYYLATARSARRILDPRVKQNYLPSGTEEIGVTEIDYCGDRVRTFDLERLLVETARLKNKLDPDLYKEVVLSFRRRSPELQGHKIAEYLSHFPRRDVVEAIIYQEVF